MDATTAMGLALSGVMGVVLGALGGGGSILTLPILLYVFGIDTKEGIAISLFVVATTSVVATLQHARAGNVRWRTGLVFGVAAMLGAYGGGRLAAHVPGNVLLGAFTVMMVATGLAMLRRREPSTSAPRPGLPAAAVALEGLVVGVFTGMVGAGGGFLVVPALVLLGGLPMRAAVGTSLLVIALKSFAGLAGHLAHVSVDWSLAASVTGAAVVGAAIGGRVARRVAPDRLRSTFAVLVLAMAAVMTAQQLPASLRNATLGVGWPVGIVGGVSLAMLVLAVGALVAVPRVSGARRSHRLSRRSLPPEAASEARAS